MERTAVDFRPPPLSAPSPAAAPPEPGAVPLPGLDDSAPPPAPRAAEPAAGGEGDPFANIDLGAPAEPKAPASSPPPSAPPRSAVSDDVFSVDLPATPPPPEPAPKPATLPDDGMNFDFVEAPPPRPAGAPPAGADMLDFVDEQTALTPKDEVKKGKSRPAPPRLAKSEAGEKTEETLSLAPGSSQLRPLFFFPGRRAH